MDPVYMPSVLPSVRSLCASGRTHGCGHTVCTLWINGAPFDSHTFTSQAQAWEWASRSADLLAAVWP